MISMRLHRVLSACCALLLTACDPPPVPPAPPLAVLVRTVGADSATPINVYTGEVRSRYETELSFRVAGKLVERRANVGDAVRKGDMLARLDPQDLRLSAEASRDQLVAAEAELKLARAELDRARQLVAKEFVSVSVLDGRRTAVDAAEARVRQARAQSELSANQANYAALRADHDAVVTAVLVDPGEVVSAGQAVLRLAREDAREVLIYVPEGRIGELRVGMAAQVRPLTDTGRGYLAQVREVAAAADPATRTFAVRVAIPAADQRLPLGASALVGFIDVAAKAMLVPLPAVAQRDGASVVWVVDAQSVVQPREVEVLALREDGALIGNGLEAGATVVVSGTHRLTPGQQVRPQPEGAAISLDAQR